MKILSILLLVCFLNAKEYISYGVGYLFEKSKMEHDSIKYDTTIDNYAYAINSVHLKQNYIILSDFAYYPYQDFAKGYSNGDRFTSNIEKLHIDIHAGFKKYIIPYFYFIPTLGLSYYMNKSKYQIKKNNYNKTKNSSEFNMPLNINFGYSLTPTSDLLAGINIDEDLTDLSIHDYQEYMIKYYLAFKNNITINALYSKISKTNLDEIRQVTDKLFITIGVRY